jgi:DNA adenine methylase
MIKSPLRYPGGKSKAVKQIIKIIPSYNEYREPFVGGGSLFIYLKQKYPTKKYWINDIYRNLYYFWKMCKNQPDELVSAIYDFRKKFNDGKSLYNYLTENIESFDPLKKAAAFFVFNRITFSGTTESGGYSQTAYIKRFTVSSIERVKKLSTILGHTRITNYDYEDVVKAGGENVFIFLDPPYFSAKKSALYGKNGNLHKKFDHERFAYTMKNCNHKWLITYDDNEYIRKLFSFANIKTWDLTYGMRNVNKNADKKGKELFIANYPLDIEQLQFKFSELSESNC